MSVFALYLVLLKATLASFSGFGSLPQVRNDLVEERQVLTDEGLNHAVLVARTTPGPVGVYVVSVGYQVAGTPGAIAGWLALATPAVLVLPIWAVTRRLMTHPRVRSAVAGLILGSAVLVVTSAVPLALDVARQWLAFLGS